MPSESVEVSVKLQSRSSQLEVNDAAGGSLVAVLLTVTAFEKLSVAPSSSVTVRVTV